MKSKITTDCQRRILRGCAGCPALGLCSQIAKKAKEQGK